MCILLIGNDGRVVVHYPGNESVAKDHLHGNSRRNVNFLPTTTSLSSKLSDKSNKFADVEIETINEQEQFQPRNAAQKRYFERKGSISTDSFLVLHELAYILTSFIWSITTYPDLIVMFGLPQFLSMLTDSSPADILLTYDTTFNLGDFYVTTLVAQLWLLVLSCLIGRAHIW